MDLKELEEVCNFLASKWKRKYKENCTRFAEYLTHYFLTGEKPPKDVDLTNSTFKDFSSAVWFEKNTGLDTTVKTEASAPQKYQIHSMIVDTETLLGRNIPINTLPYETRNEIDFSREVLNLGDHQASSVSFIKIESELLKISAETNHKVFYILLSPRGGLKKMEDAIHLIPAFVQENRVFYVDLQFSATKNSKKNVIFHVLKDAYSFGNAYGTQVFYTPVHKSPQFLLKANTKLQAPISQETEANKNSNISSNSLPESIRLDSTKLKNSQYDQRFFQSLAQDSVPQKDSLKAQNLVFGDKDFRDYKPLPY